MSDTIIAAVIGFGGGGLINAFGFLLFHIRTETRHTSEITQLRQAVQRIETDLYTKDQAQRDWSTQGYKLDEVRRRVIALENRTHGWNLDGCLTSPAE